MKTNRKLLQYLSDEKFHSGEELGHQLNITRSAVCKRIKQLSKLGIPIIKKTNKGYCIERSIELLDIQIIKSYLTPSAYQRLSALELLETVDSTNQYLLKKAYYNIQSGYAVLAEQQTAGRGRQGRYWHSPFGYNIYCSLLWNFEQDPAEISSLSLVIAVIVARVLKKYGVKDLKLKWPNDIFWHEKKIAGILLEMLTRNNDLSRVIIGIGLNLYHSPKSSEFIDQPWTDIDTITGKKNNRNQLAGLLLNELLLSLSSFQRQGFSFYLPEWEELDMLKNREITVHQNGKLIHAIAQGVNLRGELLLRDKNGRQYQFLHGEINLNLI